MFCFQLVDHVNSQFPEVLRFQTANGAWPSHPKYTHTSDHVRSLTSYSCGQCQSTLPPNPPWTLAMEVMHNPKEWPTWLQVSAFYSHPRQGYITCSTCWMQTGWLPVLINNDSRSLNSVPIRHHFQKVHIHLLHSTFKVAVSYLKW